MPRSQGAPAYEVYCHRCQVTFPVEARRCLHCGGPLEARDEPGGVPTLQTLPGAPPPSQPSEARSGPPAGREEDEEGGLEGRALLLRRFGGLALWALIALSAMLSNLCKG